MEGVIKKQDLAKEFLTTERCFIYETWNEEADRALSVARARVKTGTTTQLHALDGIDERYLIVEGFGLVEVAAEGRFPSIKKPRPTWRCVVEAQRARSVGSVILYLWRRAGLAVGGSPCAPH